METHARLPATFVDEIKRRTSLVDLIQEKIPLRRSGKDFYGCCPFHNENTPSFAVDPRRGTYLCRGCGEKGDVFTWLEKQEGLPFWEALTKLANAVGMSIPKEDRSSPVDREDAKLRNGLYTVLQQAALLYAYGITQHADAQAYLALRGISADTAKLFGLGYVRSGIKTLLEKRVKDSSLIAAAGILSRSDSTREVELLRHRITIALRNERGVVVGFSGRLIEGIGAGPKYLNSPETPIFRKSRELFGLDFARTEIVKQRSAILVEGYFDVMRSHQAGERRAVAAMGTSLSTEQAVRILRDVNVVYLALDGDKAGRAATVRTAQVLLKQLRDGQEIRLVKLPDGQDPDELIGTHGASAWLEALEHSQRLSDFIVEALGGETEELTAEATVAAALNAREWLSLCGQCPLYGQALRLSIQRRLGIEV